MSGKMDACQDTLESASYDLCRAYFPSLEWKKFRTTNKEHKTIFQGTSGTICLFAFVSRKTGRASARLYFDRKIYRATYTHRTLGEALEELRQECDRLVSALAVK